jgi:hypothetical protein
MANQTAKARTDQSTIVYPIAQARPVHDVSGYTIFSAGDAGTAHTMAHRMFDENRIELGHQLLSEWLQKHSGSGSEWIHLHFHMAIFELAMDDWDAAHTRFMNEILPAAATTEEALTDAPALLWRLALTSPGDIELPWEALRNTALSRMQRPSDPFVELHNLLALAGAGDVAGIDRWLKSQSAKLLSRRGQLVEQMALSLRAYAAGYYRHAAIIMQRTVPKLSLVGGSRAQNLLFAQLEKCCWDKVGNGKTDRHYPKVA